MDQKTPELTQKEIEEKARKSLNYNDRLDGYGIGEAESGGEDTDLREKYGEVDQYSFRVPPLGENEGQQGEKPEDDAAS